VYACKYRAHSCRPFLTSSFAGWWYVALEAWTARRRDQSRDRDDAEELGWTEAELLEYLEDRYGGFGDEVVETELEELRRLEREGEEEPYAGIETPRLPTQDERRFHRVGYPDSDAVILYEEETPIFDEKIYDGGATLMREE